MTLCACRKFQLRYSSSSIENSKLHLSLSLSPTENMFYSNSYSKGCEPEPQAAAFERTARTRRCIFIIASSIFLAVIIGSIAVLCSKSATHPASPSPPRQLTKAESIKTLCSVTQYPSTCVKSLSSVNSSDPKALFNVSVLIAIKELAKARDLAGDYVNKTNNSFLRGAFVVCSALIDDAIDHLRDSRRLSIDFDDVDRQMMETTVADIKTWLSSALTYQQTCLDSLDELSERNLTVANLTVGDLTTAIENSSKFGSNSLAIVTKVLAPLVMLDVGSINRRLLSQSESVPSIPDWLDPDRRRSLRRSSPNFVHIKVAQDGSGDFRSINEAIMSIPNNSDVKYAVHVKKGRYEENVLVGKKKQNLFVFGDGPGKTIISSNKSFTGGVPTYHTPTFIGEGPKLSLCNMTIMNTAGPEGHQAVALRLNSDQAYVFNCEIHGYQDTLYAHSNRQLYENCLISGTIDFVFGNAAVVFQNCSMLFNQAMFGQYNTLTAQGKTDPNQNTAISIIKCNITSSSPYVNTTSYLGRPWKTWSTAVFMASHMGSIVHPAGFVDWNVTFRPYSSLYYLEQANTGEGANTTKRVTWLGYHSDAKKLVKNFTAARLVQSKFWLPKRKNELDSLRL